MFLEADFLDAGPKSGLGIASYPSFGWFTSTAYPLSFYSPEQCGHTRGSYVDVKVGCMIGGARIRVRQIRCYLWLLHSTAQACRICCARAGAFLDCALVVVPCTFSDLVVTLRGRHKESLVFWWSKVSPEVQISWRAPICVLSCVCLPGP